MKSRIPELDAILRELEREGEIESMEDANRKLAQISQRYNASPQAALGGLSPEQVAQLLGGYWHGGPGLHVVDTLANDEISGAPFLHDARVLLRLVLEAGVVRETQAKYLPPSLVRAMMPLMKLPVRPFGGADFGHPPPKKEADIPWLEALRHTCIFAGLITRRRGLRVTKLGTALLADARAGELYALLFRTLFQEYNLRAFDRCDYAGLQRTIAYSFYKLRRMADDWELAKALSTAAWLPTAKEEPDVQPMFGDMSDIAFMTRVLRPLVQFGLFEERMVRGAERWQIHYEYRRTPLYSRVLRFELATSAPRDLFLM